MDLGTIVLLILAGLTRASVLFVVAAGLTLVFGVLRVINLAHGSLYMIGAFLATMFVVQASPFPTFWLAVPLVPIIVGAVGLVVEWGVLRRIYRKAHELQLLGTFALILVFADLTKIVWGRQYRSISLPEPFSGAVNIAGQPFPAYNLFVIVWAPLLALALWYTVEKTSLGRMIRAAVSDPEMLEILGINIPRVFTIVFVIGAGLAGLAGVLVAPLGSVGLGMDVEVLIEAFIVAVIGGLGSFPGALLGAGIIGLMHSFGINISSRLGIALPFVAMVIVLVLRPWGLFGQPER
ncbi:MAG: branched-chain amino acid ABC transporter permease [Chloroflexi bacterium]|nr:branched-chain amino acid ABC transporter permease [Chloroflexota bacterium]